MNALLALRPCKAFGRSFQASLPCLPLPLHRILSYSQPLQKDNNPSPRTTTLASLVKGEVLSPDKIRATTGGIATPPSLASHQPLQNRTIPPAFRTAIVCVCLYDFAFELSHSLFVGEWACPSRCTNPLHSHNHCKRTTRPRLAPPHLPPLSKGGGLAARHKP